MDYYYDVRSKFAFSCFTCTLFPLFICCHGYSLVYWLSPPAPCFLQLPCVFTALSLLHHLFLLCDLLILKDTAAPSSKHDAFCPFLEIGSPMSLFTLIVRKKAVGIIFKTLQFVKKETCMWLKYDTIVSCGLKECGFKRLKGFLFHFFPEVS